MKVTLLGAYGTKPQPNRYLTSCVVGAEGPFLPDVLIDCGEGTQVALSESRCNLFTIGVILLTHLHGDHKYGLPGLISTMSNDGRTTPLIIVGPEGTTSFVKTVKTLCNPIKFQVFAIDLRDDEVEFDLPTMHLKAFRVEHTIPCYGYALSQFVSGTCDPKMATENGIERSLWTLLQSNYEVIDNMKPVEKSRVFHEDPPAKKVVYCTDTRPCAAINENCKGADLAILEGMYAEKTDQPLAIANKHMMMQEAASIAREADVKELWLTHFTAKILRAENLARVPKSIFDNVTMGYAGLRKDL